MRKRTYLLLTATIAGVFLAIVALFPDEIVYTVAMGIMVSCWLALQSYYLKTQKKRDHSCSRWL